MPTDIAPSLGHGVLFTQGGAGSTPGYDAIDDRTALTLGGCQEGVYESGAYKVTQRAAGANMSVDVAASTGHALVQGDAVSFQDLYGVRPHSAVINEAITAADATNPRLDQVILEILDNQHDGSGNSKARVRVVTGTPTSGATLDNRSGAAALPSSAIRLADVLVAASDTSITNAEIRDRRPWARGAYRRIERTAGDYTRSAATFADIDSTNLKPRLELSGVPVRLMLTGGALVANASEAAGYFEWAVDGTGIVSNGGGNRAIWANNQVYRDFAFQTDYVPSAGSHTIAPQFRGNGTDLMTIGAAASRPLVLAIQELVLQNTDNS